MAWLGVVLKSTTLRLSAVVWTFGYILVEISAVAMGRSVVGQMFLANLPLLLLGVAQSVALGALMERLGRRSPFVRWPAIAVAGLLAGAVQTLADDAWLRALALTVFPEWRAWAVAFQPDRLFLVGLLYLWTMYLNIALAWAARTSDQARLNQARAAAFEAAAAKAEAAALRLQLNPHFLFNTLNGIASLVVRNRQEEAEDMVGRLADFLRSSLASDPTALAPLSRELETIMAYLNIEQARLGDRLRIEVDAPPELAEVATPNFILQPLVENAIKHGAARSRRPTTISISARAEGEKMILTVENRGAGGGGEPPHGREADGRVGIGLSNTRRRLEAHYGADAWLDARPIPDGYRVEIGLPRAAA